MYCINPIYIEDRGIFPCGQCRFCRTMRSNMWAMRMVHEKESWEDACFITLTYEDRYLPENGDLDKRAFQLFIKRLRKEIEPSRIRYFGCGEYGETYGRPHYHAIIFGLGFNVETKRLLVKCWPFGFVKVKAFSKGGAKYVTKYVTKAPLGRSKLDKLNWPRATEFQVQSKGLGLSWFIQNIEIIGKRGILNRGRQVPMPRYYVIKGKEEGMPDQVFQDLRAERVQKSREEYVDLMINKGMSADEVARMHKDQVNQRIENLRSMDSLHYGKDDQ